jgi:hypothetical protein
MRNDPTSPGWAKEALVSAGYVGQDAAYGRSCLHVATAPPIILRKPFLSNRIFRFFN